MNSNKGVSTFSRLFSFFPFISFFTIFTVFALTGCSFSTVNLDITATDHLNRDANYNALPVVVRVYALKNPDSFSDATFRELWHNDKKVLGDNLVSRQEFTVVPGATLHVSLSKDDTALYLGAIALFRHPIHNQWRVIVPMPLWYSTLTLSGNRISL